MPRRFGSPASVFPSVLASAPREWMKIRHGTPLADFHPFFTGVTGANRARDGEPQHVGLPIAKRCSAHLSSSVARPTSPATPRRRTLHEVGAS